MPRRRAFSGAFVISVLERHFGFETISQRGSHVKLRNSKRRRTTVVPLHKELAPGTFNGVLKLAGVEKAEFIRATGK